MAYFGYNKQGNMKDFLCRLYLQGLNIIKKEKNVKISGLNLLKKK